MPKKTGTPRPTAPKARINAGPKARNSIMPSGRVQATRLDPSVIQKDRLRGYREKGGARKGKSTGSEG